MSVCNNLKFCSAHESRLGYLGDGGERGERRRTLFDVLFEMAAAGGGGLNWGDSNVDP